VVKPIRTFLDSGVLIAAFNGPSHLRELALQTLEDPGRLFLTSLFVRLEVLPKAIFNKQAAETRFYERFFEGSRQLRSRPDGLSSRRRRPSAEGPRVHRDREA